MSKSISIRRVAAVIALVVVVLILGTAIVDFIVVRHYIDQSAQDEVQDDLRIYVSVLSSQVTHYERMLTRMAQRPSVRALLRSQDPAQATRWTRDQQALLPDSVHLALFTNAGAVIGETGQVNVSEQCLQAVPVLMGGGVIDRPPVHGLFADSAHFDLMVPVSDRKGVVMGALFGGFSTGVLRDTLARLSKPGESVALLDGQGQRIATVDKIHGNLRTLQVSGIVPGTQWRLTLNKTPANHRPYLLWIAGTSIVLAMLMGVLIIGLSRWAVHQFLAELERIRIGLREVAQGHFHSGFLQPRFNETAVILPQIEKITQTLQEQNTSLLNLSETDELTGLANRRRFNEELRRAWGLAQRDMPICVLLLDLDGFKGLNDSAGHKAGDIVLQTLAASLQRHTRKTDTAARLGGDEFVVLLIDMQIQQVSAWFDLVKEDFIQGQQTHALLQAHRPCTLSAGVAQLSTGRDETLGGCLERADEALYEAKRQGRDRLCPAP